MQADDDDDDDGGLIMDNVQALFSGSQQPIVTGQTSLAKNNANAHFRTEIAFAHVKEHELVEASCLVGRL